MRQGEMSSLNGQVGWWRSWERLRLLTGMVQLVMVVQPRGGAVGIGGEAGTLLRCWMKRPWDERLHSLLGTLWTTRPHHGKVLSLALRLLVWEGRM